MYNARHFAAYYRKSNSKAKASSARYKAANRVKYLAYAANRHHLKKFATPPWFSDFDAFVVEEAYDMASRRAASIGGAWQVDHVIPIAGRNVCGLHVGLNFQVLPAPANNRKRNRFDPSTHSEVRDSVFVGVW
jgi:hypothetical protein